MPNHFILNRGKLFSERYKDLKSGRVKAREDAKAREEDQEEVNKVCEKDNDVDVQKIPQKSLDQSPIILDDDSDATDLCEELSDLDEQVIVKECSAKKDTKKPCEWPFGDEKIGLNEDQFQVLEEITDQVPRNITVKLICNGHVYRHTMGYKDYFWQHRKALYKLLQISKKTHQLVISYNNKFLTFDETPELLGLTIVDTLECYTKLIRAPGEKSQSSKAPKPADGNSIRVKFRSNKEGRNAVPIVCIAVKNEPFIEVMKEYSKQANYPIDRLTFEFDGEKLSGKEAPDDLDMEDDSLIDVNVRD